MGIGAKVLLVLCAVVAIMSLVSALDDPSNWPMWLVFIAMVLAAVSVALRARERTNSRDHN